MSLASAPTQMSIRILNSNIKAQQQATESTAQACWESQPVHTPYVPPIPTPYPSGLMKGAKQNNENKWQSQVFCPGLEVHADLTLQSFSINHLGYK